LAHEIAPGAEDKYVDEALSAAAPSDTGKSSKHPTATQFLSALGKRLGRADRRDDERKVLRALAEEFPGSEEGKAAAKQLVSEPKK
jgi:TolA-binding protein